MLTHDNGQCTHIFVVCGVPFLFLATWMNPPSFLFLPSPRVHSKLFHHIFFKLCTHGLSHNLLLWHSGACLLCASPGPMRDQRVSRPLLQRPPDWLLFLGIFRKEAGIRVPRFPSVYTHAGAASNWENEGESGGARECGFSALHPRIPQHSHRYASTLWSSDDCWVYFILFSICSYWSTLSMH